MTLNNKSLPILTYILCATILVGMVSSCQSDGSNTSKTNKKNNDCTTTIVNRPNTDTPFSITEDGNTIKFTYSDSYDPAAYENDMPNYNSSFPGSSFFTLFGDGRYSWSQKPKHTYKTSGVHEHVYFELTKIKEVPKPPASLVNPLINDEIIACPVNPNSTTNDDFFLNGKDVAFKESRPAYCDYTFVEIIKIGNKTIPAGAFIQISFSEDLLDATEVLPYKNMPFSNNFNIDNAGGKVTLTTNQVITSETPIFIQFKNVCSSQCTVCDAEICVEIFKDNTLQAPLIKKKCRDFTIKTNDPFDPNWLETGVDECYSTVPTGVYQQHNVKGYFYFVDNNSGDTLGVTVKVKAIGNTSLVHSLGITGNNSADYTATYNASNKEITYVGLPNTLFVGEGNNATNLPNLGNIDFDLRLNPVQIGDVVTLEIETTFGSLDSFTNTLEIPIKRCTIDSNNLFRK